MGIVGTLFLIIFAITTVLIIALVMLQDEQGEGFGGLFGGSGSGAPFGVVGGNILARATTVLGVLFMASSLVMAMVYKSGDTDNIIQEAHKAAGTGKNWFLTETEAETDAETEVGSASATGDDTEPGFAGEDGVDAATVQPVTVGATAAEATALEGEPATSDTAPVDEQTIDAAPDSFNTRDAEQPAVDAGVSAESFNSDQ